MKHFLCLSVALCCSLQSAHSETKQVHQLKTQKSEALATHLTTRISWKKFPQPQYNLADLHDQDRAAIVRVQADENGTINKATIQESTGLAALDKILLDAIYQAKVQAPLENDTPVSSIGYQTFNLRLAHPTADQCKLSFESKNWIKQTQQKKTAFQYQQQPQIELNTQDLKGYNRNIKFKFKVDKHGQIQQVNIRQGSGLYDLDQQIIQALLHSQVNVKAQMSTLWLYKKSKFKDSIQLNLDACK